MVIKPVLAPQGGRAVFTLDDVASGNGIMPAPGLTAAAPAPGARSVPVGRVLTAFFNQDLDPATLAVTAGQLIRILSYGWDNTLWF